MSGRYIVYDICIFSVLSAGRHIDVFLMYDTCCMPVGMDSVADRGGNSHLAQGGHCRCLYPLAYIFMAMIRYNLRSTFRSRCDTTNTMTLTAVFFFSPPVYWLPF